MSMAEDLKHFPADLADVPEQYQSLFKAAAAMVDVEQLLKNFTDENVETLFPLIRKTLLTAVIWTEKFAGDTTISKTELLRSGLGRGLFALQCTGTRNFSRVEWQIKSGIRACINAKANKGKKPKIKVKTVCSQPEKCPFCGSNDIKEIIYGMPRVDFDYSRYISGGCVVMPDSPKWHCDNCFAKFKQAPKRSKKDGNSHK